MIPGQERWLKIQMASGWWRSGRQGCNPAGEGPVMSIVRFRTVAIPTLGEGNKRVVFEPRRSVQAGRV